MEVRNQDTDWVFVPLSQHPLAHCQAIFSPCLLFRLNLYMKPHNARQILIMFYMHKDISPENL